MRRVVFNRKGGVGKSSITVNLAAISAEKGLKTLIVDLDVQANASQYALGDLYKTDITGSAAFFEQFLSFRLLNELPKAFVTETPFENLHVMAASPLLAELHNRLESKHKIFKLRDALRTLEKDYQAIYIDTPPALNFYTLSALIAANRCLIPFDCDQFARQALYELTDNVAEIKSDHNATLKIEGIVANQFQPGAKLPARILDELLQEGLPVLKTRLGASVKMRESHEAFKPLIHSHPKHKLTMSFRDLYNELERI